MAKQSALPDRLFHNFRASKSGDRWTVFSSEMSVKAVAPKLWKGRSISRRARLKLCLNVLWAIRPWLFINVSGLFFLASRLSKRVCVWVSSPCSIVAEAVERLALEQRMVGLNPSKAALTMYLATDQPAGWSSRVQVYVGFPACWLMFVLSV